MAIEIDKHWLYNFEQRKNPNKCATLTKTINIQYIAITVHYSEYTKISNVESNPLITTFCAKHNI